MRERGGPIEPDVNAKGAESESERDFVVTAAAAAGLEGGIAEAEADGVVVEVVTAGVCAAVAVVAGAAWPADALALAVAPALTIKLTVSPSLIPSYSLSNLSSAIAFPLNIQRWLAGSGAPWSLNAV